MSAVMPTSLRRAQGGFLPASSRCAGVPPSEAQRATQRDGYVRSFQADAEAAGTLIAHALPPRSVAVRRIVGSVGRAHELGPNFRPRKRHAGDEDRYTSVVGALTRGKELPPIDVYKLGHCYYVVDGNHRVAAARTIGQLDIDAVVTEFVPTDDPVARRLFVERRAFERATGLTRIGANHPGSYLGLAESMRAFAAERGTSDGGTEGATRWYYDVYQPRAARLRRARLWEYFPGARTADIFVQLARFREEESRQRGLSLAWSEATDLFIARYGHHIFRTLVRVPLLRSVLRRRMPGARLGRGDAIHAT